MFTVAGSTDEMGGYLLSRPLGLGVTAPDGSPSPSSEERVPWVVVEKARAEGSSLGLVVGLRF